MLSYNGSIAVFIVVFFFIKLINNENIKIKEVILVGLNSSFVVILEFLFIKCINSYFNTSLTRISNDIVGNLLYIIKNLIPFYSNELNQLFPKNLYLIFISTTLLLCLNLFKHNAKCLYKILCMLSVGLFSSLVLHLFSLSSFAAGRIHVSVGMALPLTILFMYKNCDFNYKNRILKIFLLLLVNSYFIVNIINFYIVSIYHVKTDVISNDIALNACEIISEYEKNNIQIKYITYIPLHNAEKGHYKIITSHTSYAVFSECSFDEVINLKLNRKLSKISPTNEIVNIYLEEINKNDSNIFICYNNILICPLYNI